MLQFRHEPVQSIAPGVLKWDEGKHPRQPGGTSRGGEFTKGAPDPYVPGVSAAEMQKKPLPKTLAEAEDRIRNQPNEHSILIRDGKPFKVVGDNDSHHVFMDGLTPEDLKDVVLTHNHPSGFGLSNQDGISAAKHNMLEMRAVTATGTHSIRRTGTEWPQYFEDAIMDTHDLLMLELGLAVHDGEITAAQANAKHHELMYQRLQKHTGGFVYTFEPKA